jgi:superfamily II DNA or RNA helicase
MIPRRRFSGAERAALYLAADGSCSGCGCELRPGWHADHVEPWSKGGVTDVTNGQALCPDCNLRKGSGNMDDLRKWQSGALAKMLGTSADFLTVATPGAGKTRFALTAARRLIDLGEVRRVIVVVPTAHLRRQWAEAAVPFGIQIDHSFSNQVSAVARDVHGVAVTYSTVASQPLLWKKLSTDAPTLVVLDEVHHGGDELAWGSALKEAFSDAARRLLLSGTPFRSDGSPIPFVTYGPDRECVPSWTYDYGAALQDHDVVRPIEFLALDGDVRWRDAGKIVETTLADADDETLRNALVSALSPDGDWIPSVLRQADDELDRHRLDVPDAGGLVVASNQFDAEAYAHHLTRISGERPEVATHDKPDASDRIARFAAGSSKWIVAVQMISEGVDIPRLSVGVYGTRTRTEMFFRQLVGRFVRMRGPDDETTATLLIPSIQPLLEYAQTIEQAVLRALAERDEKIRADRKNDEMPLRLDLVEPLDSSVATHHSTILAGDSFTDDELRRALEMGRAAGMPSSVTAAQLARVLRMAGAGRVVGSATVTPPLPTRTIAEEKKSRRRLVKRKVGQYQRLTDVPFNHIHGELNRACGDTADTATVDTLDRRLEILDGWLENL